MKFLRKESPHSTNCATCAAIHRLIGFIRLKDIDHFAGWPRDEPTQYPANSAGQAANPQISDVSVLRTIAGKSHLIEDAYDPNHAFTRFVHDGSPFATELLKVIEPGGWIRFVFDEGNSRSVERWRR